MPDTALPEPDPGRAAFVNWLRELDQDELAQYVEELEVFSGDSTPFGRFCIVALPLARAVGRETEARDGDRQRRPTEPTKRSNRMPVSKSPTDQDRLAALEEVVRNQSATITAMRTSEGIPAPRKTERNLHVSELDRQQQEARERRLQAAAERAAAEQVQAERERPQRERREQERAGVVAQIVAENARHEQTIAKLSALQLELARAPLRKRVVK